MFERRIRAVYRLGLVGRAVVGPRRGSAVAVVEVDRGDRLAVHRSVGAVFLDVEETVVGAVLVLPGLFIAAGTGADLDVLQRVELLEDRAACGIDDHQRAGRGTAPGRVGKERNLPRHVRTAVVADEDHLPRLLGLHAHAQQAAAQRGALGARQCLGAAYPWRDGGQFGRQAFDLAAEQRAALAVGVLADDHVLAVDRNAPNMLLGTGVAHAVPGGTGAQHGQRRVRAAAAQFRTEDAGRLEDPDRNPA